MRKDQTMKRKRHTEEQIIAILKEHEAGVRTADLCRKHGISEASSYNWKAKYGGLEVSEAKRLKGLESENARLKKLLADAMLDNAALKDQIRQVAQCKNLGLFAEHVTHPELSHKFCIDLITNTMRLQRLFDRIIN